MIQFSHVARIWNQLHIHMRRGGCLICVVILSSVSGVLCFIFNFSARSGDLDGISFVLILLLSLVSPDLFNRYGAKRNR